MIRWDFLSGNPVRKVSRPKEPKVKKGFLAPEHIRRILELCPQGQFQGARRRAMFLLLLTTGMRLMELAGLKLEDLNWEGKFIRVMGKGSKERVVPFHREAQHAVWRYLAYRRDDHPCVWVTEERRPMGYYGVQQDLHRIFERAGLRGKLQDAVHIFRRTWAVNALRQGMGLKFVQVIGGWESVQVLEGYVRALEADDALITLSKTTIPTLIRITVLDNEWYYEIEVSLVCNRRAENPLPSAGCFRHLCLKGWDAVYKTGSALIIVQ